MGYCLRYIYQDCFILETETVALIFDYWKDPLTVTKGEGNKDFPPLLNEFSTEKQIYVLVSHHHKDHFTRRIFLWNQRFPDIRYIISEDVYKAVRYMLKEGGSYEGYRPGKDTVVVMSAGETYEDDFLKIKAFGSTDIGNSYAIETEAGNFFHAGDLNAWLWLDESTVEEVEKARDRFVEIIEEISKEYSGFDLAMFPVDSRLGREYWWGAAYFVRALEIRVFVPMHFELVLSEDEKEQRRIDAAAFNLFARPDYGDYVQLASTRACFYKS